MISKKEYTLLNSLLELCPRMDENQRYKEFFIDKVVEKSGINFEDVIGIADGLEEQGYIHFIKNSPDCKRPDYIHMIRITAKGASVAKSYKKDKTCEIMRNIVIPAIVSIICTAICNRLF